MLAVSLVLVILASSLLLGGLLGHRNHERTEATLPAMIAWMAVAADTVTAAISPWNLADQPVAVVSQGLVLAFGCGFFFRKGSLWGRAMRQREDREDRLRAGYVL